MTFQGDMIADLASIAASATQTIKTVGYEESCIKYATIKGRMDAIIQAAERVKSHCDIEVHLRYRQ